MFGAQGEDAGLEPGWGIGLGGRMLVRWIREGGGWSGLQEGLRCWAIAAFPRGPVRRRMSVAR